MTDLPTTLSAAQVEITRLRAELAARPVAVTVKHDNHVDVAHADDYAIYAFAAAMVAKMDAKRAEGRGGWEDKNRCSQEHLSKLLIDHIAKGDPADVANFAMMLHQRGEQIKAPALAVKVKPLEWYRGEHGLRAENYIGVFTVYRNQAGTWTLHSGECYSDHESEDAAKAAAIPICAERIASVCTARPEQVVADEAQWHGEWQWWAGVDDEWLTVGPCPTRDDAISEMVDDGYAEYLDETVNPHVWRNKFYICEAKQDPLRLSDWIGLDWLLERAEENLADSDRVSYEHDDGPWFDATKEQEAELCEALRNVCDDWQVSHGLKFHSATFSHTRNGEDVTTDAVRAMKGGVE